MSLSGAMCSVMMYSNLALGATNQVTLEFSTPHGIAPDGVLLCATAADHRFDRSTFVVNALEEGGSQFLAGTSHVVAGATDADLLSVRAFSGATTWNHRPVETGVAADVLGLDARYAETYARRRYDDMVQDAGGAALDGVFQEPEWAEDAATRAAAADAVVAALDDATTAAARAVLLKQLEELNRPAGNCALLTGSWVKNTRYELVFSAPNPLSSDDTDLGWWMAPVSYSAAEPSRTLANGGDAPRVTYAVRGDARGARCSTRASVSATLLASGDAAASTAGLGAGVAVGACAAGEARSVRFNGRCVSCASAGGAVATATEADGVTVVETCACPATVMTVAAGPVACGAPRGPAATATTEAALAAELCATYAEIKAGLDLGPTAGATAGVGDGVASGAHAVASAALDAFVSAGASFVDDADIAAANATYRASMLFDERAPDDPSRGGGLRPSCQKCAKRFGARDAFVDDYGVAATVKDVRFEAAHALRLIGYVLSLKGHDCAALYDEEDPYADILGARADADICEAAVPS